MSTEASRCDGKVCVPIVARSSVTGSSTNLSSTSIEESSEVKHASLHYCFTESPAPILADNSSSPAKDRALIRFRKLCAEFLGTGLLVFVVVGSGISAENLADDAGLELLINAFATVAGLYCLIVIFGPVSGAHFNPIVSLVDTLYKDMSLNDLALYTVSQVSGGILGTVMANVQYKVQTQVSDTDRFGYELWISEVIATFSLILIIHGCIRTGQKASVPSAVSLWVGGGYFFTSSSIFANPAVTIARVFTPTYAGIEPRSMAVFIAFQVVGAVLGYGFSRFFYPHRLQPLQQDDNLYRRACVLELKEFFVKETY